MLGLNVRASLGLLIVAAFLTAHAVRPVHRAATKIPAPACPLVDDPAGDATPFRPTGNVDALDIRTLGLASDGTTLSAFLLVNALGHGGAGTPAVAGDGARWIVSFRYTGTVHFLSARFPAPQARAASRGVAYTYGVAESAGGSTSYETTGAASGAVEPSRRLIRITAPRAALGAPAPGATLRAPDATAFEIVSMPAEPPRTFAPMLEKADETGPGAAYTVGSTC